MNLPTHIQLANGSIDYTYDASGIKLQKTVDYGSYQVVTDYMGGYQYETKPVAQGGRGYTELLFFPTAEGYVKPLYKENDSIPALYQYVYIYKDHLGNNRLSYTLDLETQEIKILEENHYYPFGLKQEYYNTQERRVKYKEINISKREVEQVATGDRDFKYKYNGKELQDELNLNQYDYGARLYDPLINRWTIIDEKSELYFANSPYNYALNTPTNAVDPDGKLVIFINGLGGGDGDENYWRGTTNIGRLPDNPLMIKWGYIEFDNMVMDHLNDHHSMYIDGSPGWITNNLLALQRFINGWNRGYKEAESIIASLARDPQGNITENIKIITHSMGGVFGKGFVYALKNYIRNSKDPKVRAVKISLVADFDSYQAGSVLGKADDDIFTQQFTHASYLNLFGFGCLANEKEDGADDVHENEGETTDHFIVSFFSNISDLREGKYVWDKEKEKWICTNCK